MPKPQTKKTNRALKASRGDPTSPENVMKNVMKFQKISTEYFEKMSISYEEKVQTMNLSLIERNQEIAQLKKKLGEIERKIQELNLQNSELTRTNQLFNEKNATVYGKYVSLEVDYDQKIKKLDLQMNKQKIEILAQQKRNEELSNELTSKEEDNLRGMAQYEAIVQEKVQQMTGLQLELTKMQERIAELQAVLEKERTQHLEQKHELQSQFDKGQTSLQTKIQEFCVSLDNELMSKLLLENQLQESVQKLQDCEKQNVELQQQQHNFKIESSNAARCLKSSIEIKQSKIDDLKVTLADLRTACEVELKCSKAKIEELKAANEELNAKIIQNDAEAQQKLNKQEELMTESRNKVQQMAELQLELTKLQERTAELQAALEKERTQQLEQKHELHSQFDKAQASLQTKIQELCVSLDHEMKSKVLLENQLQESVQKLQDCEKQNVELQQQQHNFTIESSDAARSLKSSIEIKQAKIDDLKVTLADLRTAFEDDVKCQQAKIEELKAANEELNAKIIQSDAEAQQKLNKQEELMTESRNKWDELENQHLDMINELTAAKINLEEQIKGQNEVHEIQLTKLLDAVKQREDAIAAWNTKYFHLEMEKNTVIMELNQKITCIGDVVESGKETGHENATKPGKVDLLPSMKESSVAAAEGKRLKRTHKRSNHTSYESDWKTDSDDDLSPDYKPKQKKRLTNPFTPCAR